MTSLEATELAEKTLKEWDEKKIDPVTAYAALGYAFFNLHIGLGHGKKEWLETTKQVSDFFHK